MCNYITDTPLITNLSVEDTGTTFITISWTSTSVGSVTYTITYSTGDVMISSITDDTNHTINGLTSGTSYKINVVPIMEMCQGKGKEMMVDTNHASTVVTDSTVTGVLMEKWFTCSIHLYIAIAYTYN